MGSSCVKSSSGTKKLKAMIEHSQPNDEFIFGYPEPSNDLIVPEDILMDCRLTMTDRVILAYVVREVETLFIYTLKHTVPSNNQISFALQISRPTITRAFMKFQKLDLLHCKWNGRYRYVVGGSYFRG